MVIHKYILVRFDVWLKFFLIFAACIFGGVLHAESVPVIGLTDKRIDISANTYLMEDPAGNLTIDDVIKPETLNRFKPGSPRVGQTTSAYWMRFRIKTSPGAPENWWFDTGNRTLQEVSLYWRTDDGHYERLETGSTLKFSERPLPATTFVFPLLLNSARETEVYLRVRSTGYIGVAVSPALWIPEAYRSHEKTEHTAWIFLIGLAVALSAVNLLLALYNRDINNLVYVFVIISYAFSVSCATGGFGSAFEVFWPNSTVFQQISWLLPIQLTTISISLFITRLLDLHSRASWVGRLKVVLLYVHGVILAVMYVLIGLQQPALASSLQFLAQIGLVLYSSILVTIITELIAGLIKGKRAAWFIFVGFIPLMAAAVYGAYTWSDSGETPWHLIWPAMVFEWFITAVAVADKYSQVRQERASAKQALFEGLQRSERELEIKVAQRTVELAASEARAKDLLHNILPADIADELFSTGTTRPVRHESATVLFTDFNGFTQAAASMPADRMVAELNEVFAAFDDICDEEGVEKIKTIGDAYMAAAGLPKPCDDHAQRCVRAGLRMAAFVENRNADSSFKWRLRVGVHSGPVIAGVVGKRKYAFDIWGDSVNIAARMESASDPGRVNVSAYTRDLVRRDFECEYRGKLQAKGKGEVDMYFVTRGLT